MKKILTVDGVAAAWCGQYQPEAETANKSLWFDGVHDDRRTGQYVSNIHSYHTPIASWHKRNGKDIIFITGSHYSVTTQKHLAAIRHNLKFLHRLITVHGELPTTPNADMALVWEMLLIEAIEKFEKAGRARKTEIINMYNAEGTQMVDNAEFTRKEWELSVPEADHRDLLQTVRSYRAMLKMQRAGR